MVYLWKQKASTPKTKITDEGAEAIRISNLESFTYDDAARMFEEKDMTVAQINQTLKSAGYDEKDIQEFTKELTQVTSNKPRPSLGKDLKAKADTKK